MLCLIMIVIHEKERFWKPSYWNWKQNTIAFIIDLKRKRIKYVAHWLKQQKENGEKEHLNSPQNVFI